MKKIRSIIALMGAFAFLGFGGLLWFMAEDRDILAILLTAPCFVAAVVSFFGLWNFKRWALVLSRCVAVAAMSFGGYLAHFAWTFWLFKTPTLWDRLFAVLQPRVSFFIFVPVLWLGLSLMPAVKTKFLSLKKEAGL